MKRFFIVIIEIIICFLLQTTFFQWIALANVVPNLLLILTVSIAFMRGRNEGIAVGLVCGLLVDFCYGNVIGLYGFIYMVIGYFNGFSNKIFVKEDLAIPIVLMGISEFVYFFLYYVFEFLLRGRLNLIYYFVRIGLPEIVYTILISIFLYKLLNVINSHIDRQKEEEVT